MLAHPHGTLSAPEHSIAGPIYALTQGAVRPAESGMEFNEIYEEYRGMVTSTARHLVGSSELEDVVQMVFLEVFRSLDRFRGESKLKTWIYRITVNVALQHRRRRTRKKWLGLFRHPETAERTADPRSMNRIESRNALRQLQDALQTVSEKKRTAFVLVEIEQLTPAQSAEILNVPVNTVRSRVIAARTEIVEYMKKKGALDG